jgi:hypothetical protein
MRHRRSAQPQCGGLTTRWSRLCSAALRTAARLSLYGASPAECKAACAICVAFRHVLLDVNVHAASCVRVRVAGGCARQGALALPNPHAA